MIKSFRFNKVLLMLAGLFMITNMAMAQQVTISGTVRDAGMSEVLPGVTVLIKGTTTGTITTPDGTYTLNANKGDVLMFSFIGYMGQEITVGDQTVIDVQLEPEVIGVGEVVVIGYGVQKKEDKTGSVVSVSSKDFNKGNITSPQDLLVGKSSGVVITSSGGAPGSGSTIRIRGGSSLNASNDPLIIVDGMPIEGVGNNVSGSSNALSFINPNDIETFTVLKDASATAIYGSRASNGVIIITTKKGSKGTPLKLSYSGSVSISTPEDYVDVYSGDEMRKIALDNEGLFDPTYYNLLGTENTDWQDEIFRTAISHDHNFAASGAYKNLPYRVSLGYTDQTGILENTDMQRFTASLNLSPSLLDDHLKVNANAKLMSSKHNFGDDGAIGSAISMDPTQPVYEEGADEFGGYYQWQNHGANLGTPNPVEQAMAVDNQSDVIRFVGNLKLDYKLPFLPELKASLNLATDYNESDGHNNRPITSPSTLSEASGEGKLNDYGGTNKNNLLDFYLNYNKELTESHRVDATAGYSWQHFEREGNSYTRVASGNIDDVKTSWITENYLVSFFGRLNYAFRNKYLLTGTFRYDGSSRFDEDNRWGFFPSTAFAWKIHEEAFLKDVDFLSDLKLRLGWGITGQQDIGNDYPAQAAYTLAGAAGYYMINGEYIPTLRPETYDPDIKWEETTTQNIGIDFGFLNNRINGTIDYYFRETEDLLNTVTIPSGSNFSNNLLTNVGSLENKGIEVGLNFVAISKQDMSLNLGLNFSHNKNEITKLLLNDDSDYIGILYGDAFNGITQVTRVGEPAYSFFMNKQVYGSDGKPVEGLYEDLAGNGGVISGDNGNKYVYHSPAPEYTFGFSARFNYKDFDISTSLRANIDNYVLNQVASGASYDQMQQIGYWKNMPTHLSKTNFVKRQFTSDYFVENASFLKMDNISAGYNFNKVAGKDINARVSFTVQNVFTITEYTGLDPEVDEGIDNNFYPRPRTFTLGVNLTF
ncbi:SusC/RagA family TonB-linked outer membrane protein [Saccharicrinis fermentans]|uniref:Outer membrane cobalamin receptor protein n=1 Tax=Saccharicrinis fermentans DSM 9555 = JCM 21142 TaxID=869213 RepID=W7YJ12_9BACT|nr:TonB-dependent receptor [Saccharicrinis fermentans]GAF02524.1 outer membrane cobalamin receptor protein [Saccharicrinis fermentans DSM 9555 = JCM 21142]